MVPNMQNFPRPAYNVCIPQKIGGNTHSCSTSVLNVGKARCFTSHAAPVRPSFVPKLTPSARSPRHAYQGMRRPSSQLMTVPVVDMSALRISYRTRLQPMCGSTAPSMSQMCAYFLVISVRLKPGWSS